MHDQDIPAEGSLRSLAPAERDWSTQAADDRDQAEVLLTILTSYPTHLRMSELVLEITAGSSDFPSRDRLERAVRDLVSTGLLFRCESLVLPTRSALRFNELVDGGRGA